MDSNASQEITEENKVHSQDQTLPVTSNLTESVFSCNLPTSKLYNGKYLKVRKIGFGSYGKVYLVVDKNNKSFAMKKYYLDAFKNNEKEIKSIIVELGKLNHSSIPVFHDFFFERFNNYLISDFYPMNLIDLLKKARIKYSEGSEELTNLYKSIMYLIAESVYFLHSHNFIHRDLKPENIMVSLEGTIKILDFDLAIKLQSPDQVLSRRVGTLYYKPAEIFFGETKYGFNLDLWGLGCIFAEIILNKPIFESQSEIDTLSKITEVLGAPTEENYPGVSELETYMLFNSPETLLFDSYFSTSPPELKYLIKKLLDLNPSNRPSAEKILNFPWFQNLSKEECVETLQEFISN